ncbi:MAG: GvpL/GvpF family gas vesicle protein [Limnoraphis robusta]
MSPMKLYNLYTYAFLKTPTEKLKLPVGITNPVLLITSGTLSAVVEPEVCLDTLQNDEECLIQAVLCHDRVIYELFQQTTVLPLRFGISFIEAKNLLIHLNSNAQEYQDKIEQLEGKGEYLLKCIPRKLQEPVLSPDLGGRQYFLAKKQHYQAQQNFDILQGAEWQNIVHLVTEIYPSTIIIASTEAESRIYLLVKFKDEYLLTDQFLNWQKACPRWELQLGQVSPPYHFI